MRQLFRPQICAVLAALFVLGGAVSVAGKALDGGPADVVRARALPPPLEARGLAGAKALDTSMVMAR